MCNSISVSTCNHKPSFLPLFSSMLIALFSVHAQAAGVSSGFSGNAYGTGITVGAGQTALTPGTTSIVQLCTLTPGVLNTNSLPRVLVSNLMDVESIDTGAISATFGSNSNTTSAVSIASVNLLNGLVRGTGLAAVATATYSGSVYGANTIGTSFGTLEVLNLPVPLNVAPNTTIALPGVGSVVLNEQTTQIAAGYSAVYVNLIHVKVTTANSLGLPIGTSIIVGSANASLVPATSFLTGGAYEASISAAGFGLGPATGVSMPCGGTGNQLQQNSAVGLNLTNILALGALTSGQYGSVTATAASGETASEIVNVNLLSGLVQATSILAVAGVSANSTSVSVTDAGSVFTGLSVTGHPEVGANPGANTEVQLANLGTLYLHRVIQTPDSIEVRMIELVVGVPNTFGLPVGADIILGDANLTAVVHP